MSRIKRGHYYLLYPEYRWKNTTFRIEYRQISRTFNLYQNGQLYGKYRHSDLALLTLLRLITGYTGDEVPAKYQPQLKQLEKAFELKYQGLVDD